MELFKKKKTRKPSMKRKLVFSLSSIAIVLILSGVISMVEYRRMSDYMSTLIASNVQGINDSQRLYDMTKNYNDKMQYVVMKNDISQMPDFDLKSFSNQVKELGKSVTAEDVRPVLNDLTSSFADYMNASLKFDEIFLADSINTADWFFNELQLKYNKLCANISILNEAIRAELKSNAISFDAGFYRSIIPGIVSVGAGLMLVFLLMYYIIAYYVNPICRMSSGIDNYRSSGKRYGYEFEGDDQLANINSGLTDLIEENLELKKRLRDMKEDRAKLFNTIKTSGRE